MRLASRLNSNAFTLILIQVSVLALILIAKAALDNKMFEAETVLEVCSYCLTLNIVWTAFAWHLLGGSLFSPFILFMASVSVFNSGQVVLEVFGLNRGGLLDRNFPQDILTHTVLFVFFAISALNLGGFIAATSSASRTTRPKTPNSDSTLRHVAGLLFLVAFIPSVLEARRAIDLVIAGGYMALYQGESATGFGAYTSVLFGFLVPSAFLLLAGSGSRRLTRIVACSIIGAYILLQSFLGFRGSAMVVLATSLWLWNVTIAAVPKKLIITLVVATTLLLPVMRVIRVLPTAQRSSLSAWISTYAEIDNPAVALIREMGGSMLATAYTIELVPDTRDFEYGASYGYALSTLMPNLFWNVHPGVVNSPSKWLVETVSPETAQVRGGLGYSLIAEGYLNFGFLGAAVPMLLLGWGVGALSRRSEMEGTPGALCFIALATMPLLIYARAEAGNALRSVVWYGGLPYLLVKYWPKRGQSTVKQLDGPPTTEAFGSREY